jgi:hypothetical protein
MELDFALLADSAQVSDGKTYILGGGVSIVYREQYPAPLGVSLVFQLKVERAETDTDHQIRVLTMDADGNPVLPEIQGTFKVQPPPRSAPRNIPLVIPLVIAFPPLPVIQRPGAYDVQILVDGRHLKTLPFAVTHPPAQPSPP